VLQVLGAAVTCKFSDIRSAQLWLNTVVRVDEGLHLMSDILVDTLASLQRTGVPAFIDQELPGLCDATLEALHSISTFQGCLTRGVPQHVDSTLSFTEHSPKISLVGLGSFSRHGMTPFICKVFFKDH